MGCEARFCKFLTGSFSAVSKWHFARKYAFDSIFHILQDLHTFAPLQTQHFSKFVKFLDGSFSAVWTATIARNDAFFSKFRDLQDLHTFAPLQSQKFSKILQFFGDFIKISGILLKFCENFQKFKIFKILQNVWQFFT